MKKILIIGDSCEDVFIYGKCIRLSPEAPVPIYNPIKKICNGGMSINVYNNLKALKIKCDIITNKVRPVKTRYVDEVSNQMLLRVDEKDIIYPITNDEIKEINYDEYSAIIISDYNKGFLSTDDIKFISENHQLTFLDTKKKIDDWCLNIKFIKINENEYNNNNSYLKKYNGNLIVTKGKDGAILNNSKYFLIENEHSVRDLSGAGDTFLASLVANYIKSNDICTAIRYANKCASWVVTQKGVIVVDINKI